MQNYESLKSSEQNLRGLFFDFYNHVIMIESKILERFSSKKPFDEEILNQVKEWENKSNNFEAQIMDEACWIISKDSPKANHLRFIIAILNSIKDLERISDYMLYITKYMFYHQNLPIQAIELITSAFKKAHEVSVEYLKLVDQKDYYKYYDKAVEIEADHQKHFNEIMVKIAELLSPTKGVIVNESIPGAIIVLKNIERSVDHSINIVENFVYIKQSEFFLDKNKVAGGI